MNVINRVVWFMTQVLFSSAFWAPLLWGTWHFVAHDALGARPIDFFHAWAVVFTVSVIARHLKVVCEA